MDFGDLAHGIDALEAATTEHEREHLAGVIEATLAPLPQAAALVLVVNRWAVWGGAFDNVRAEFATLKDLCSPWAIVQHIEAEHKAASAAGGAEGGRTSGKRRQEDKRQRDDAWVCQYKEARRNNPNLTANGYAAKIAKEYRDPDTGKTFAVRTVRQVLAAHKVGSEPPLPANG